MTSHNIILVAVSCPSEELLSDNNSCVESCQEDADCDTGFLCCRSPCGHVCSRPQSKWHFSRFVVCFCLKMKWFVILCVVKSQPKSSCSFVSPTRTVWTYLFCGQTSTKCACSHHLKQNRVDLSASRKMFGNWIPRVNFSWDGCNLSERHAHNLSCVRKFQLQWTILFSQVLQSRHWQVWNKKHCCVCRGNAAQNVGKAFAGEHILSAITWEQFWQFVGVSEPLSR